eukprot:scaffold4082_cov62-Phaeocystis_antarctica.AAC.7
MMRRVGSRSSVISIALMAINVLPLPVPLQVRRSLKAPLIGHVYRVPACCAAVSADSDEFHPLVQALRTHYTAPRRDANSARDKFGKNVTR